MGWLLAALVPLASHAQPAAPARMSATPGDAQATLQWSSLLDSSITSYQVRQGSGSPLTFSAWATVPGSGANTRTATVTGLTNGTRYTFEVRAVSGSGNGAAVRASTTLAASPSATVTIADASLRGALETALGKSAGATITQGDMAKLERVPSALMSNQLSNVASLSGINHAVNLQRLEIGAGTISDLSPLSGLTSLTRLWLNENTITDISHLSALTALTDLQLTFNSIANISHLSGLTALTDLRLNNNSITNVSSLAGLTALTTLHLDNNSISDVSHLSTLTSLTELWLNDNSISDISRLSTLTALTSLRLSHNAIGRVSLSGLTALNSLELGFNSITDVALSGLSSLTVLYLDNNSISTMSLSGLTALTTLWLYKNSITDVAPLAGLTSLTYLDLTDNSISDISRLVGLTALTSLLLGGNWISDISALSSLTSLTLLSVRTNFVSDVMALSDLTSLTTLSLGDNSISDVSHFSGLTSLQRLWLHCNSIEDVSPLVANSGLASGDFLGLWENPLDDASVATHIPALQARGVTVVHENSPNPCAPIRVADVPDDDLVDDPLPPNHSPQAIGTIAAASLEPGQQISLVGRNYFNDPDYDILTFSASSSNPAVAAASVGEWDAITVTAVAEGLAEVTLSATDPGGLSASLSFMVTVGSPASLGGAGELSAFASAPEGGVVELTVSLPKPRETDVSLTWAIGVDDDPATADADAADHGGVSGTVVIPAGETGAAINIAIADDADIEPAREVFVVSLTPQDDVALGVASATVHIEEGVCDRTPQVADALRGMRDCAAVTTAELERRVAVRLTDAGLAELRPLDFLGMAGMTILQLDGNGLSELPSGLLSGSPRLRLLHLRGNRFEAFPTLRGLPNLVQLDMGGNLLRELPSAPFRDSPNFGHLLLDGNQVEVLPADLIAGLRNLRQLELQDNAIETLPDGFFTGFDRLYQLKLHDNPGAPFALDVGLEADDAAEDADAEGAVSVRLSVPQGAPFDMAAPLTAEGGILAAETAVIAAGRTVGALVEVRQGEEGGAVTVSIDAAPVFPPARCGFLDDQPCFRGVQVRLGEPLTLFDDPAPSTAVPTLRR